MADPLMEGFSYSGPDLGITPLTPEQLGQIDPKALGDLGTPGSVQEVQPVYSTTDNDKTTTTETEAERIARLNRESAERIASADRESRAFRPTQDARATIGTVLQRYGLGNLSGFLYNLYARQEVDITNPDALIFAIREQDEYKRRFAANTLRANNKDRQLAELDPATYLALEDDYRRIMQVNGMPEGFYNTEDDFTNLIAGDVSPAELQDRIQEGYNKVSQADPEVKRQMQQLYGIAEGGLAAYFLDPEKATQVLQRQAKAAQISARAREQAGFQLGATTAEDLVARGFTPAEAEVAFTKAGQLAGLYQEMGGEEALTQEQKLVQRLALTLCHNNKLSLASEHV